MQRTQRAGHAPVRPAIVGVEIRPTRMDDEQRVRDFLSALSLDTQTQRFFAGMTRPSASLVRAMVLRDERKDALVAVAGDAVIGHAMSIKDGSGAEIAVVVADEWQAVGVGGRLVRTLLRRRPEARWLGMDVLSDNRRVLSMIRKAWPEASMRAEQGSVLVRAPLAFAE